MATRELRVWRHHASVDRMRPSHVVLVVDSSSIDIVLLVDRGRIGIVVKGS